MPVSLPARDEYAVTGAVAVDVRVEFDLELALDDVTEVAVGAPIWVRKLARVLEEAQLSPGARVNLETNPRWAHLPD